MKKIIMVLGCATVLAAALAGTGCVRHWDDDHDERHERSEHHDDDRSSQHERYEQHR